MHMEIPFVYGKIVSDNDFVDRREETEKLVSNILSQTNTGIISPRRWGKSSLVNKAIKQVSRTEDSILFVRMNAFKCETQQDFFELFAKRIVEEISTSAETVISNAREFQEQQHARLPCPSLSPRIYSHPCPLNQ